MNSNNNIYRNFLPIAHNSTVDGDQPKVQLGQTCRNRSKTLMNVFGVSDLGNEIVKKFELKELLSLRLMNRTVNQFLNLEKIIQMEEVKQLVNVYDFRYGMEMPESVSLYDFFQKKEAEGETKEKGAMPKIVSLSDAIKINERLKKLNSISNIGDISCDCFVQLEDMSGVDQFIAYLNTDDNLGDWVKLIQFPERIVENMGAKIRQLLNILPKKCPNIEFLIFSYIKEDVLLTFNGFTNLKRFFCYEIKDRSILTFLNLPKLHSVNVGVLSWDVRLKLCNLPSLEVLSCTHINPRSTLELSMIPNFISFSCGIIHENVNFPFLDILNNDANSVIKFKSFECTLIKDEKLKKQLENSGVTTKIEPSYQELISNPWDFFDDKKIVRFIMMLRVRVSAQIVIATLIQLNKMRKEAIELLKHYNDGNEG